MTLKEPIVEGAYYERDDGCVIGPSARDATDQDVFWIGRYNSYRQSRGGEHVSGMPGLRLTRRVWIVATDPAEVVAELRKRGLEAQFEDFVDPVEVLAFENAADLVAVKLGVTP